MAGMLCPWCGAMIVDLCRSGVRSISTYACGTILYFLEDSVVPRQIEHAAQSLACHRGHRDPSTPAITPVAPPAPLSAPEADNPTTRASIDGRTP